jgi:hypothetical protein
MTERLKAAAPLAISIGILAVVSSPAPSRCSLGPFSAWHPSSSLAS